MSRQINCRDMCKFLIWMCPQIHNYSKQNFQEVSMICSQTFCEMGPLDPFSNSVWAHKSNLIKHDLLSFRWQWSGGANIFQITQIWKLLVMPIILAKEMKRNFTKFAFCNHKTVHARLKSLSTFCWSNRKFEFSLKILLIPRGKLFDMVRW